MTNCKSHSSSGCCCGHSHDHNHNGDHHHDHDHDHDHGAGSWLWPALSGAMLLLGIVLQHLGVTWMASGWTAIVWYLAAFLPVGWPVLKEGWQEMRQGGIFNEFTLMTVAAVGAFCIGEYPEGVAVMLLYTVGERLQHGAVGRARRDIARLLDVRPERASVWRDGHLVEVTPEEVATGEEIEVLPGGRVPLDGTLTGSPATFDTSALTGESVPRTVDTGGEVLAGMMSADTAVRIRVTRPYSQSTLARILHMVREAADRKAPAEMFIRRFARVYTPVVMILALLIVVVPWTVSAVSGVPFDASQWIYRGLVFLVISCPCALVISVPLSYFAGIGAASRRGVLFKGGNCLDALADVDTVAFDKTGTLTTGQFGVTRIYTDTIGEDELLGTIKALEQKSTHPIARAAVAYADSRGAVAPEVSGVHEVAGAGIEARIGTTTVLVGNMRLMRAHSVTVPDMVNETVGTLVICAIDGKYAGCLELQDMLKDESKAAVEALRGEGIANIILLSGDRREVVADCAAKLNINDARGALLPDGKAEAVSEMIDREGKKVAFVGDGMNDAPVLALSTVGVAMGGVGSDAAVETADVVIQNDNPSRMAEAIAIARRTRAIVRQNIAGAIGVKAIVLVAGALGYASLWAAVFADVGVALLAVLNSLRVMYNRTSINDKHR